MFLTINIGGKYLWFLSSNDSTETLKVPNKKTGEYNWENI